MKSFFKTYFDLSKSENIIGLLAATIFLPYQISAFVLAYIVGYIIIKKNLKKDVFCHTGSIFLPIFCLLAVGTAVYHGNYLGLAVAVIFFLLSIVGLYVRTIMTAELYEKMLSAICFSSLFGFAVTVVETLMFFGQGHRCYGIFITASETVKKVVSFYFSPTYLAVSMAAVVIICIYKIINNKGKMWHYYIIAICAMVTMYLAGSLFVWVNLFSAIAVYLLLSRHKWLFAIFFLVAATAIVVLYFFPFLPRLSDAGITSHNRILIWNESIKAFPQSPFFGQGFQTYGHIYHTLLKEGKTIFEAYHSHNIIIDPLVSFGIVGVSVFACYAFAYIQKLVLCMRLQKKSQISIIIMAIATGMLIHGIIDMTMLWIQPMVLYSLIFSGVGADEKKIAEIFEKRKHLS